MNRDHDHLGFIKGLGITTGPPRFVAAHSGQTGVYGNHIGVHRGLDEWKRKWTYRTIWGVRSVWVWV